MSAAVSPYSRFNLWRNPFGELSRVEWAELSVVDCERWREPLTRPQTVVQFMGACGHGKTTHLLSVARLLPGAAYVYLPEEGPRPRVPDRRPLLIDEAQRLRWWQRRHVFRRGGPLVLGTHRDLTRSLARYGLEVFTVDVGADRTVERLTRMLERRIASSRRSASPIPGIDATVAHMLLQRFGGNVRGMNDYLYRLVQQAALGGEPWPLANFACSWTIPAGHAAAANRFPELCVSKPAAP